MADLKLVDKDGNEKTVKSDEMELTMFERCTMFQVLPTTGTIANIKTLRLLREKLAPTETEKKDANWRNTADGNIEWDNGDKMYPILMNGTDRRMCREALERLNSEKKITEAHLTLCEKFGVE